MEDNVCAIPCDRAGLLGYRLTVLLRLPTTSFAT
jgi:hypothetical protein